MSNITQARQDNVTRDQVREQIRETVKIAREASQDAARDAQREGQVIVVPPIPPLPPIGTPAVGVAQNWDDVIPPQAVDISIAFFIMVAVIIVGYPIMRAIGRRIEGAAPIQHTVPADVRNQLQQIAQSVDAIAIEVERISEGQRFTTKMLAERSKDPMLTSLGNSAIP
ncbi:MAG: hypothetical protein ABIR58_09895 [Gemmatimonadaceae bacterium]